MKKIILTYGVKSKLEEMKRYQDVTEDFERYRKKYG